MLSEMAPSPNQPSYLPALVTGAITVVNTVIVYFLTRHSGRRQIVLTKLQEKRAEIIAELYRLLASALDNAEKAKINLRDYWTSDLMDSAHALMTYVRENRIYFPVSLCKRLDSLVDHAFNLEILTTFGPEIFDEDKDSNRTVAEAMPDTPENRLKKSQAIENVLVSLRAALEEIESEFRRMLGVNL